jgi:hypothetical protein
MNEVLVQEPFKTAQTRGALGGHPKLSAKPKKMVHPAARASRSPPQDPVTVSRRLDGVVHGHRRDVPQAEMHGRARRPVRVPCKSQLAIVREFGLSRFPDPSILTQADYYSENCCSAAIRSRLCSSRKATTETRGATLTHDNKRKRHDNLVRRAQHRQRRGLRLVPAESIAIRSC